MKGNGTNKYFLWYLRNTDKDVEIIVRSCFGY